MANEIYATDLNLYWEGGQLELEDALYDVTFEWQRDDDSVGYRGGWEVTAELVSFSMGGHTLLDRDWAVTLASTGEIEAAELTAAAMFEHDHLGAG
jgi:hypothetical protein